MPQCRPTSLRTLDLSGDKYGSPEGVGSESRRASLFAILVVEGNTTWLLLKNQVPGWIPKLRRWQSWRRGNHARIQWPDSKLRACNNRCDCGTRHCRRARRLHPDPTNDRLTLRYPSIFLLFPSDVETPSRATASASFAPPLPLQQCGRLASC